MNARQKAKHYKKKYNELWHATMNAFYKNQKFENEMRARIMKINVERRYNNEKYIYLDKYEEAVIKEVLETLTKSEEFKQSVAIEKYVDPLTDETVYRAYLQTIRPKMEEE